MSMSEPGSGPALQPRESASARASGAAGTTAPQEMTQAEFQSLTAQLQAPALAPPGQSTGVAVSERVVATAVTGTWTNGITVDGMWSINEIRNAWMHVTGVGWKKIYNGSDAAFVALTTLASHARQTGRQASIRVEADNMVHEVYAW